MNSREGTGEGLRLVLHEYDAVGEARVLKSNIVDNNLLILSIYYSQKYLPEMF